MNRCGLASAALLAAITMQGARAAGSGGGDEIGQATPEYQQAMVAIKAERWAEAIKLLDPYVARSGRDADGHNWLGYAYRKSGQLKPAFFHYKKALAIDPRHRGAHEYIGEAYLMDGNIAQAEAHLKTLQRLCNLPCEEVDDLNRAIAAYKARPVGAAAAAKP